MARMTNKEYLLISEKLNAKNSEESLLDFCNDPACAWEVISRIFNAGLTLAMNESGVCTGNLGVAFDGMALDVDDKPLRAAMIVLQHDSNKTASEFGGAIQLLLACFLR